MSNVKQERRKSKRYDILLRVYFPEFDLHGLASNISLDGCYVEVDFTMSEGFVADMLIDLPVVGVICIKGYIQRKGVKKPGMGLEFVQVRFEADQSEYFSIYSRFVRVLPQLERIHSDYQDKIQSGELRPLSMPDAM